MSTQQLTRNQTLVYQALEKAEGPLSAYSILDKLRDHGFRAPLQVYRALEKLLEFGLVHRLESLNAFVACAHPQHDCCNHGTVAFAICERCGHVREFHDHSIDHRLEDWAKAQGFKAEKTTIEIRGLCAQCRV
ncbi:Fur family transcriptional regulator [Allorhizobium undicola]|uniref:Fur family transcriptional regulator n=1 Tax=Allorhizobium undicola TaxID=78527 RepID=UPI003D33B051